MFQAIGAGAYKPGLQTAIALDNAFGMPHRHFKSIHIGGTNGKGSTAHTIAAVLQSAGYKVGLYTSPHLIDFRERIRVDGRMIPEKDVCIFLDRFMHMPDICRPSFFELTTAIAFDHFAKEHVDYAVIEVGLGGRLDSTNIISPELCVITNISLDHVAQLGDTTEAIAKEKAGIIKAGIPVIIGEAGKGIRQIFEQKAQDVGAPVIFAEDSSIRHTFENGRYIYHGTPWGDITGELSGDCQPRNANTIFHALECLRDLGVEITGKDVAQGFGNVTGLTGLMGRWMTIKEKPAVICDTGHNTGGWTYLSRRLKSYGLGRKLHMVIGFVNDKDIDHILEMMPDDATYYFVAPSIRRARPAHELKETANARGLEGNAFDNVPDGYDNALSRAEKDDVIFVGGSTFVVADLLACLKKRHR